MAPLSDEEEHYVRLGLLLKGVTPRAVRTYFDREFPPTYLPSTLNTNYNTLWDLKLKRIINQAQWNLLIPKNGVPDSKTFDVTLMVCLIRNLTSISSPINGFDSLPLPGDTTPGSDLARIKYYRNKLGHHDSNTIDTAYFHTWWTDISNAVDRLGGQQMYRECQELKVKMLNASSQEITSEIQQSLEEMTELKHTMDNLKLEHANTKENDIQLPWLVDAEEFERMLLHGTFLSYEHCLSLGGPCRAGKSTLASVLIGKEIPLTWNSTDGLVIYFGRNGIDIDKKKMVPLEEDGSGIDVFAQILRGKPDIQKNSERITMGQMTTHRQRENSKSESLVLESSSKYLSADTNRMQTFERQKLQSDILDEVRNGKYSIEIAPSDLIDFGGQNTYDMTHQLFIQHKGSFLLMFDGKFGLHNKLKDYPEGVTAASILKHWVDSILTYTADTDEIMPMILFAATHRDKCGINIENLRKSFKEDIINLFCNHDKKNHIHLETVYFINAIDENDVEIKQMTDQIVIFAMKQSTWGQRRPMQWVPLELQLSNMRMRKHNILTKDDISKVNELNEDLALNESQLEDFLNVQHSLGKLIYYPLPLLDNFVIIYPPALVNILRSFVTCTQFFPEKENLKSILHNLTVTGKIYKKDLFKLWNQDQFQQYMPNDATKEFILQLLIHLDILIIPKAFKHTDRSNELYIVPCMIKESRPVNCFPIYNQGDKTIFLRYSLISGSIPSALTYKVIGAVLSVWPLKEENDRPCLYHKAAVLNVVEDNELRVWVDNNQILVQMTNAQSLQDMSKDVAASIQECLTWNLESCIEFYSSSFGRKIKLTDVSKLYSLEVGIPHHTDVGIPHHTDVCYISVTKVNDTDTWVCEQGCEHSTRYLRYWIFNRSQDKCEAGCTGLSKDELESEPNEKHLVRLGSTFGIEKFKDYYSKLGMDATTFENIAYDFKMHGSQGIISVAMIKWKMSQPLAKKTPTMNDLFTALGDSDATHRMCKVFREKISDDSNVNFLNSPTDEALSDLSQRLGSGTVQLGIELGLNLAEIEQSCYNCPRLQELNKDILLKWKNKSRVKTTRCLMMALQMVNNGGATHLNELVKNSSMFERITYPKQMFDKPMDPHGLLLEEIYEKKAGQTGLAVIVNYSHKRHASEADVERLKTFFVKIVKYHVEIVEDKAKSTLMQTFESIRKNEMTSKAADKYHCFVLVMMCHGEKDTLHITTTKGVVENMKVQEVIDQFKLTDFSGKPKFFIFQACRHQPGTRTDEADSLESQNLKGKLHEDADLLVSYATTPGYKAYRELYTTEEGSWFIREMINVFKERYEETDVINIMMAVRRNVEKCRTSEGGIQMTQDLLTLRKKFFL